jgi:hypothetical protein
MIIVLAVLLAAGALVALAYPILVQPRASETGTAISAEESLAELMAQRENAFQAIRDLQFDHEVGKVSDEDLTMYEVGLKQNAAESLRRLDAWENQADRDLSTYIERQVAARRAVLAGGGQRCPHCARTVAPGAQFCTSCGTPVQTVVRPVELPAQVACPKCGKAVGPGDRFCPKCGQPIAQAIPG